MKELIIPREKWLRGVLTLDGSFLLRKDGMMCCLGHFLKRVGVPKKALLNEPHPNDVDHKRVPNWLLDKGKYDYRNSKDGSQLMSYNDNTFITDAQKEKQIKKIFKEHGWDVKFTGKRLPKRKVDSIDSKLREVTYEEAEDE